MFRLLRIEWRRMWSRRLPWVLVVAIAGVMLCSGVIAFATSSPAMPDASGFEEQRDRDVALCRQSSIEEWDAIQDGSFGAPDPDYENYLSQFTSAEEFANENCNPDYFSYEVEDPRFCLVSLYEPNVQFRQACPDVEGLGFGEYQEGRILIDGTEYRTARPIAGGTVPVTSLLLLGVAAVVGATFVGAEYSSGTIETTLLWETRRRRVLGSKLIVAGVVAAIIHTVLLSFLVVALVPAALWRGSTAGADGEFWWGLAGVILRGGVAAAAVAAIAMSVSTVTRNTVGGVVALLGYIAVSPAIGATLVKRFRPYDFTENIGVFANGGEVARLVQREDGYFDSVFSHGGAVAMLIVAGYVAIAVLIATMVFARRDID